jgi:ribosome-associated protein
VREDGHVSDPIPVPTRDATIRLGQFLKLAGAVDQGSDAKTLLGEGAVRVNGETDTRRGRQLTGGDLVEVADVVYRVEAPQA